MATGIELVRSVFTDIPEGKEGDDYAGYVLWNHTGYPQFFMGDAEVYFRHQLVEYKKRLDAGEEEGAILDSYMQPLEDAAPARRDMALWSLNDKEARWWNASKDRKDEPTLDKLQQESYDKKRQAIEDSFKVYELTESTVPRLVFELGKDVQYVS